MGRAARRRALEHFHWDMKGSHIQKIYKEVVSGQIAGNVVSFDSNQPLGVPIW
jgi:hypothetical protein